jgi:thiopeptide-type bacteriocin biosynthesis protein
MSRLPRDHQSIVDAVVASFNGAAVPGLVDSWSPTELGVMARVRDAFLAAGTEHVRRMLASESWLQVGLAFADAEQARRFQSASLLPAAVEMMLAEGLINDFFFMNKPPGMRLRFSIANGGEQAEDRIIELVTRARDAGLVEGHEFGIYDQETHQFGGAAGIDIFHQFSTHDSLAILKFRALEASGRITIDQSVLSLLAMNDLIARVAEDAWEQWDVWCEMRLTGRLVDATSEVAAELRQNMEENLALLEPLVFRRDEIIADLTAPEMELFEAYTLGNRAVASALREAGRARTLQHGPRKILPFFIIFHWNRLGLSIDEQVAFSFFMSELLSPKRERR